MKKKIIYIILCCSIIGFVFGFIIANNVNNRTITTDSGWDTDYESGSSSSSSSSGYSGSSDGYSDRDYERSYDRNDSYSSGRGSGKIKDNTWFLIIFFVLLGFYLYKILKTGVFDFPNRISKAIVIFELILDIPLLILYMIYFDNKKICLIPEMYDYLMILYLFISVFQFKFIEYLEKNKTNYKEIYKDVSRETLEKELPDYNLIELKMELFSTFKEIQKAWMDFDYETIKNNTTNELYNSYKAQLKVLNNKKNKNIMSNIVPKSIKVFSIDNQNDVINVRVYMRVSLKDYIIDSNNKIMQGNKRRIKNNYIMTFVRAKKIRKYECPSCGKELNIITTEVCPYCESTIVVDPNKLVLSKKTNLKTERGFFDVKRF